MSFVNVQARRLPFIVRYVMDLIAYRHLLWNLVGSDLRSRFRRTQLGILWALVQPLSFAAIVALVWGGMHGAKSYWEMALYIFSGLITFEMISAVVNGGQDALLKAGGHLKQARIPFLLFQLRTVFTASVVFAIAVVGVLIFALCIGVFPAPGLHLLLIPAFFLIYFAFLVPLSILMSLAGCYYRDIKHISGLAIQALMLTSPVLLPREQFDTPQLEFVTFLNPIVPLLDMFRDPILYGHLWDRQDVIVIGIWTTGLWVAAIIASVSVGRRPVFAF